MFLTFCLACILVTYVNLRVVRAIEQLAHKRKMRRLLAHCPSDVTKPYLV